MSLSIICFVNRSQREEAVCCQGVIFHFRFEYSRAENGTKCQLLTVQQLYLKSTKVGRSGKFSKDCFNQHFNYKQTTELLLSKVNARGAAEIKETFYTVKRN